MITIGRPGRRFAICSAAVALIGLALVVGVGWYYSSLLHNDALKPDYTADDLNLEVIRVEGDRIVLAERAGENVDDLDDEERWGLDAAAGYGHVGATLAVNDNEVTREFELLTGSVSPGDYARLDSFAYEGDPQSARGLDFRNVAVPSPLGELPAWKLDGTSDTWVIFVHGWRSDREEALRILPVVSALGYSSLVITYRNDEGAPPSADGLIRFGATEWQDLEAAVDYAVDEGAGAVILYGYSTGGGIAVSFLERSDRADVVIGAVLDAPLLSFGAVIDYQGERRGIPGFIVAIGKQFATWRFDLDWAEMDHLSHLDRLDVPILLFHGDDDDVVPLETSERLAWQRGDLVRFNVAEGAGHVRSWNVDPEAYEQEVRGFLNSLVSASIR
jgi:pimeloyl-ACP methyl ester carboxylesterase